ncbi:hypothetical protein B0H17DRAFT_339663 [Mycena rosella]|uniref:Uncharacterized protein n=1 Tax=Mycena rosella TaxID=1033263 RepID=A0AAD7CRA3_MYCRO|nr:hypothetical protein B0H17DRAFT_339663 [Mycena rosella]
MITGVFPNARWGDLDANLSSALLDFVKRQTLRSLRVCVVKDIPRAVFLRLVTSAPMLSFFQTHIEDAGGGPFATAPPDSSCIESLLFEANSTTVSDLLSRQQLSDHVANLRRLSLMLGDGMNMIWATAPTLEYIRLDGSCFNSGHFLQLFPAFPSLRSLEIVLNFSQRMAPWLIDVISRIFASDAQSRSPTITEMIVTFYHPWYRMSPADISAQTFTFPAALERVLFRHPTVPCVLWRAQDHEGSFAHFARFVRAAMPNMQAREKVALEQFASNWNGVTGYLWT